MSTSIKLIDTRYVSVKQFEYNDALESVLCWMLKDIHQLGYYKGWDGYQGAICGRTVPETLALLTELRSYVWLNKDKFIEKAGTFRPIKGHYQWDGYTPESIYKPAMQYLTNLIEALEKVPKSQQNYRVEIS